MYIFIRNFLREHKRKLVLKKVDTTVSIKYHSMTDKYYVHLDDYNILSITFSGRDSVKTMLNRIKDVDCFYKHLTISKMN